MKTAISIPDPIFRAADKLARRLGMTRSRLYTKAVMEYIQRHRNDVVCEKLNEIYEKESSSLDQATQAMQWASIDEEEW
jgi:metal-responsive CopG/Arc/MetJ family transcriptional regulator